MNSTRQNIFIVLITLMNIPALTQGMNGNLNPEYLRCEYLVNPLGIDVVRPRLSWIVKSSAHCQKQSAYQIIVSSSLEKLNKNQGDIRDTKKVSGDNTICHIYNGKPLQSGKQYFWKIKVWDNNNIPSEWSEPAVWSMGLLSPDDWESQWISRKKLEQKPKKKGLFLPAAAYFRKEFSITKSVKRAVVYASALGFYELHINGNRVGKDYFTPGWTDYKKRVYYNTYDITGLLVQKSNVIGAVLADGWFSGYVGGGHKRNHYGKDKYLLAQIVVEYTNGTTEIIKTDNSWKTSTGPLLEADLLMGEIYDARLEQKGWDKPGFNQLKWQNAEVNGDVINGISEDADKNISIKPVVQSYPANTVQMYQEIKPVKISEPKKGIFVYDMGMNFVGMVRLKVKGKPGDKIVLRFAERLNPDGTIYTENLRGARATDSYICMGNDVEIWQPRFTYHGFQYVELTGYPGKPDEDSITGIEITSANPVVGSFECDNIMINQLYKNICQSQRANFIDVPTDCPQRDERLGWLGDAQIYICAACMNSDVQKFFAKWLQDLTDSQKENGQFPCVAPRMTFDLDGGPAWSDAGVICPWVIYEVYGDTRLLERQYPSMKRFLEYCEESCVPGTLPPEKYHCFGDWLNINDDTPKDVIFMVYFACSTKIMEKAARVLNKDNDEKKYNILFEKIKKSFNKNFVEKNGKIKGDSQTAYAIAIVYDLLNKEKQKLAGQHLINKIKSRKWHLSTGFVGTKDLMPALAKIGRNDVAYRLLNNTTFPSWGFTIKNGAKSIWERWDGWTPSNGFQNSSMNSFSHYSFGAVGQWMFENIGGIQADSPDFKKILIAPEPGGGLTSAKVSYNSIRGKIISDWKIINEEMVLNVTIPANTTAKLFLPTDNIKKIRHSGKSINQTEEIKYIGIENGKAALEIGSGEYVFRILPSADVLLPMKK